MLPGFKAVKKLLKSGSFFLATSAQNALENVPACTFKSDDNFLKHLEVVNNPSFG